MTLSIAHHVYNQVQLRHLLSRRCFFKVPGRLLQYKNERKKMKKRLYLIRVGFFIIFYPHYLTSQSQQMDLDCHSNFSPYLLGSWDSSCLCTSQ